MQACFQERAGCAEKANDCPIHNQVIMSWRWSRAEKQAGRGPRVGAGHVEPAQTTKIVSVGVPGVICSWLILEDYATTLLCVDCLQASPKHLRSF